MTEIYLKVNDTVHKIGIENNMINAAEICKLGGKTMSDYKKVQSHKNVFSEITNENKGLKLFELRKNFTWMHIKLINHLAKWISEDFDTQIKSQINNEIKTYIHRINVKSLKRADAPVSIRINIKNMKNINL